MSKAEENRHVSLCLEDAMKETNELKSQVSLVADTDKTYAVVSWLENNKQINGSVSG